MEIDIIEKDNSINNVVSNTNHEKTVNADNDTINDFNENIIQASNQVIKNCYLCDKGFNNKDTLFWVSCEKCDNWYCGSCSEEHDINISYYCKQSNYCKEQIKTKTFEPFKTSSPISNFPQPRNQLIQIVRQRQKRAANDMIENNNNKRKKQVEYEKDDKVSVLSMAPDKLVGDVRRIPANIIGKFGTRDIFYELVTHFGILNIKYRASDLEYYYGDINISDDAPKKKISLREATKFFNNHPKKKLDNLKTSCKCKGRCFEDKRCTCWTSSRKCTSRDRYLLF